MSKFNLNRNATARSDNSLKTQGTSKFLGAWSKT